MKARLALGVLLALSTAACGVPIDTAAHKISVDLRPPGLPAAITPGSVELNIYFVSSTPATYGKLVPAVRQSTTYSDVVDFANAALGYLFTGPNQTEKGITTALNPEGPTPTAVTSIASVSAAHGRTLRVATVALDDEFLDLFGTSLLDGYGQIVDTLCLNPSAFRIDAVLFTLQGASWPALQANGEPTYSSVGPSAYASLTLPPPRAAPSTTTTNPTARNGP